MKRKPKTLATRNPFVVLAMKRKAGTHRKPNKAIRRAEKVNTRALSPATDSLVVFENALPRWRNGSRAGLRNQCLRTCRFESDLGHQFCPYKQTGCMRLAVSQHKARFDPSVRSHFHVDFSSVEEPRVVIPVGISSNLISQPETLVRFCTFA